jgi:uncharacterized protein (DUF952 family)
MIVHICERAAWEEARRVGEYPASLAVEGFIHASQPEQVLGVANRYYPDRRDLLLLWIDPQSLGPELRYEPADGDLFPHISGALNLEAVVAVVSFPPDADGIFRLLSIGNTDKTW